jgi:multimeric flavodoxin WrbA
MKVVALLGSPRSHKNSATIANRFTATAAKLGAETRTFELNRLSYRGCQGCYVCKTTLEGRVRLAGMSGPANGGVSRPGNVRSPHTGRRSRTA